MNAVIMGNFISNIIGISASHTSLKEVNQYGSRDYTLTFYVYTTHYAIQVESRKFSHAGPEKQVILPEMSEAGKRVASFLIKEEMEALQVALEYCDIFRNVYRGLTGESDKLNDSDLREVIKFERQVKRRQAELQEQLLNARNPKDN